MATILAHIKIKPGKEAEFEDVEGALWRKTHSDEENVRRYEFFRGAEEGLYYGLLSFDDFVGFLKHQTSPHHENAGLGGVIDSIKLEWVDPVGKASALAPTNKQDLPAGASELMTRYHAQLSPAVQDWWQPLRTA
jgi:hypothetical protein